jgi:hypothetical protein
MGATDFARLIAACESMGPYGSIGGLAVNCYVEPAYTLDAGLVAMAAILPEATAHLEAQGFKTEIDPHSVNALAPGSVLRIQFTTDERCQTFRADRRSLADRLGGKCLQLLELPAMWVER